MKRLLALALALAFLSGCASGRSDADIYARPSGGSSSQRAETVVRFFGFKADAMNLVAIENAIHGFMGEHPGVEVSYEGLKGSAYFEALDLRAKNGLLDDIFMVHHSDVLRLAGEGRLTDLSGLSTVEGFSELAKSQFTGEDGGVYFLPTAISTYALYVNLDLLEEHGFSVPGDWGEFSRQCDYFASLGVTPVVANNSSALPSLMTARGLSPVYVEKTPEEAAEMIEAFNSGRANIMDDLAGGVRLVGTMLDRGWLDPEEVPRTNQTSDDLALFAEGDRPFMVTGGWASQRLAAMNPPCDYAVYPLPVLDDGAVLLMNVDTCVSVNAASSCLEEALGFVEYLTQPDVIYEYCDTQSCYTPLEDDRAPSDRTIAPAAEYLFNGRSVIGSDFRLNIPLEDAELAAAREMLSGASAEEAVRLLEGLVRQG